MLIASSKYELQALVTTLKEKCENSGLSFNVNKTKLLVFERIEERTECKISLSGKILEQENEVVYLIIIEMDAERCIAAGNRVNCIDETAKRQHSCRFGRTQNGSETWSTGEE